VCCSVLQWIAVATMSWLKRKLLSYRVHARESSHRCHPIYMKRVRSYRVAKIRRLPSHARGFFWKRDLFVYRWQQMSGPSSYARDPLQDSFWKESLSCIGWWQYIDSLTCTLYERSLFLSLLIVAIAKHTATHCNDEKTSLLDMQQTFSRIWWQRRIDTLLQRVPACCSVLQCVADLFEYRVATTYRYPGVVCCSVLQCVVVCCRPFLV